jgi:DNA-binding IclR family transcriptional regulator
MTDPDTPVKATATSVRILELLEAVNGATLTELAERLELAKSSIHNHVTTLERLGFVVRDGWTYHPSLRFLEVGASARNRYELYDVGRGAAQQLASASGLTASLVACERGQGVCLYAVADGVGERPLVDVGTTQPLHCTAPGKAMLAHVAEDAAEEMLERGDLEAHTENTLSTRQAIREERRAIQTQGLAFDREEWREGVRGVGAAIGDTDGSLLGALAVVGEADALSGKRFQQDVPGLVLSSANAIRKTIRQSATR